MSRYLKESSKYCSFSSSHLRDGFDREELLPPVKLSYTSSCFNLSLDSDFPFPMILQLLGRVILNESSITDSFLLSQSVIQLVSRSVGWLVGRAVGWLVGQSVSQPVSHLLVSIYLLKFISTVTEN